MATTVTLKPNAIDISGSTSGTTTLQATAVAGTTTLTLPAATDTLVGRATTDTLTNKTLTGAAITSSTGAFTTLTSTGASSFATSSGDVGIGTSSPAVKFHVQGSAGQLMRVTDGTTGASIYSGGGLFGFNNQTGEDGMFGSTTSHYLSFVTNGAEAARINSSGNLGIGNTSPGSKLGIKGTSTTTNGDIELKNSTDVANYIFTGGSAHATTRWRNNLVLYVGGAQDILFETNATERARITSGGYFKASDDGVYAGSANTWHEFNQSANTLGLALVADNASFTSTVCEISAARTTTNNSYYFLDCAHAGVAYKLRIADSGNVTNTNNSYGAISDIKLKENIVDATPKLEKLNQVRVVNFNFIGDQQKQLGVIAQELEQVFPGMIDESHDKDAEGNDLGTTTKSVKYSVFVPMLIKAMQELKAEIDSLKSQLNGA